ncbi:hypothetical protein ES708_29416 [subsurface metagenome]
MPRGDKLIVGGDNIMLALPFPISAAVNMLPHLLANKFLALFFEFAFREVNWGIAEPVNYLWPN